MFDVFGVSLSCVCGVLVFVIRDSCVFVFAYACALPFVCACVCGCGCGCVVLQVLLCCYVMMVV